MTPACLSAEAETALATVAEAARASVEAGERAQIVFDLDDTLFLVRPRKRVIFGEIAEATAEPQVRAALRRLAADAPIPYDVAEALGTVGVTAPETVSAITKAFFARFFDGGYTRHDAPNAGARDYVAHLHGQGVRIVYLTGRPSEMAPRTLDTLRSAGFPVEPAGTALVTKTPELMHLGDAPFKGDRAEALAAEGRTFAIFDNEPANLNAMRPAMPEAHCFLLDTDRTPDAPALEMAACVLTDFAAARAMLAAAYAASPAPLTGGRVLQISVSR